MYVSQRVNKGGLHKKYMVFQIQNTSRGNMGKIIYLDLIHPVKLGKQMYHLQYNE